MANDTLPVPRSDVVDQQGHEGIAGHILQSASHDGNVFAHFTSNPFFTGGLGLAGFAATLALGQRGLRRGASFMRQRLLVDCEINIKDSTYPSFLYWMTKHQQGQLSKSFQPKSPSPSNASQQGFVESLLHRISPRTHHLSIETTKIEHPNGSIQTEFFLIPGPGRHILRYKNAFLMVNRMRENRSLDRTTGKPWETVTLTTLYSNRHIFEDLFLDAHRLVQQSTEGKTIVYTSQTASWAPFGEPRKKRPLDSVILDKGVKERISLDVKDFLRSGKWYYDRGIPYRRGYLLHGPPGSGKSSFVQALAGELDYSIAMLNLSERGLTDDRLNILLSVVPKRTLVLLEDADAAFGNRRTQTDTDGYRGANVTFSGLLNALDGVASAEERILFLTTNHVERLDSALVRPGRVDMAVCLDEVTRWQSGQLWDRFYGDLDKQGAFRARFLERLDQLGVIEVDNGSRRYPGRSTSAAALQGLFLYNKDDMEGAIAMAPDLLRESVRESDLTTQKVASLQGSRG